MTAPICAVCRTRLATHVCQACGRTVCSNCINPSTWTCSACNATFSTQVPPSSLPQFSLLSVLLFVATAAIFIGMLLLVLGSVSSLNQGASGGAIILIGPIPIILGSGPYSFALVAVGAVLMIVTIVFFLILRRRI